MVIAMPGQRPGQLSVASLNTLGIPVRGSGLAGRYAAIAAEFEAGRAEVVCFQEVLTYWHLRLLARRMPSFRYLSYRRWVTGPAGAGLVTFSRRPVSGTVYLSFGAPPTAPGIPRRSRIEARLKGALLTQLARPELCIVNTHPIANRDDDWSRANRFYPLHHAQLAALAQIVGGIGGPAVVCGDFNVDRDSSVFGDFMAGTGLVDAFGGNCPATYRAEYLRADQVPRCIDFILTTAGVRAEAAGLVLADQVPLPGGPGYVSDHIGLCADLLITGGVS